MVTVIHNVGGVQGLHLALDAFSEDIERRLFDNPVLFGPASAVAALETRKATPTGPPIWNDDIWKMSTLVRELFLDCDVPPNYCLGLEYPKNAGFQSHYDSRTRWGEAIVGISLGQASVMYFEPGTKKFAASVAPTINTTSNNNGNGILQVEVKRYDSGHFAVELQLPRRSIYIMSGQVRYDWKHGIRKQTTKRLKTLFPNPSSWNSYNLRRSMTFRSTKAYSDAYLEHAMRTTSSKESANMFSRRIVQQSKFKPSLNNERLSKEALQALRVKETAEMHSVLRHESFGASFGTVADVGGTAVAVGNNLGGSAGNTNQGNDSDDFEEQLQKAIRMSLGNEQKKKRGAAEDVIVLDDSDDGEEDKKPAAINNTKGKGGRSETILTFIDDDDVESEKKDTKTKKRAAPAEGSQEDERERIRLARLRRFG